MKVQGMDLALNHGAIVQLVDGELDAFWYWTTCAGSAKLHVGGVRLELIKTDDKQVQAQGRLAFIRGMIHKLIVRTQPDFVAVEDYAMNKSQGSHQMGEVGGAVRLILWDHGIRYRTHDPHTLKMFAAHDGSADKLMVEEAVRDRWGADFSRYNHVPKPPKNPPKKPRKKTQDRTTSEDLADAFSLAKVCTVEALLRSGDLTMKDLDGDKERQVFNRVTKRFPVNILAREWIYNPDWRKELARRMKQDIALLKVAA